MKTLYIKILFIFMLTSCEQVIDLEVSENTPKLVVEASITNETGPNIVKLTKSVKLNDDNIYPEVKDALVIVKDNIGTTDTLKYTKDGYYETSKIVGKAGNTYFLSVKWDGKEYTAQSTMPELVVIDSLRIIETKFPGETQKNVVPMYKDPERLGNSYRLVQRINNRLVKVFYAYNDNVNNGKVNERPLLSNDPDDKLKSGDSVSVELQSIDQAVYNYYLSLSQQAGSGPGGGTTPANPPSNISGGALGIFSAYCIQRKAIIIP